MLLWVEEGCRTSSNASTSAPRSISSSAARRLPMCAARCNGLFFSCKAGGRGEGRCVGGDVSRRRHRHEHSSASPATPLA